MPLEMDPLTSTLVKIQFQVPATLTPDPAFPVHTDCPLTTQTNSQIHSVTGPVGMLVHPHLITQLSRVLIIYTQKMEIRNAYIILIAKLQCLRPRARPEFTLEENALRETVFKTCGGGGHLQISLRTEVLYNILIEFAVPSKLFWLITMCLNETYSKVRIGNIL
jgi:hypothetical protein